MRFARQNVMSPEELASEFDMSESRLADLRSEGKGPPYFKFGGIWYPKEEFDSWVLKQITKKESEEDVIEKEKRQVALSVQVQRTGEHGQHRFGRHATKHEGSRGNRSRCIEVAQEGETADSED
jgi:hypothetical protein